MYLSGHNVPVTHEAILKSSFFFVPINKHLLLSLVPVGQHMLHGNFSVSSIGKKKMREQRRDANTNSPARDRLYGTIKKMNSRVSLTAARVHWQHFFTRYSA